jgi:predicted dehydrogenase
MPVRVGVVGCGFMGKTHLGIYAKNKRAIVTAFCDIDPKKAKGDFGGGGGNLGDGGSKKLGAGAKGYRKVEDLITDKNVDVVDICLPTYLHAEYAIKALNAGKHVLCEKPLTVDLKDAERVVKAAKSADGMMMAAHCMRFWPEWAWLKDVVDARKFGKVHSAVFRRFASTPTWTSHNWILNADLSGSALFDLHIHDSDFIRYVFGDPKAVFSVGNGGKATRKGIDHIVTSYMYKDPNLLVSAEGGWNADPTYGFTMRYTVVFEKATVDFDLGREGRVLQLHKAGAKQPEVVKVPAHNGWEGEIDYFLKCVDSGKAPTVITPTDARDSVALVHAELESLESRKPVKF